MGFKSILILVLLAVSTVMLAKFLSIPQKQLDSTSKLRFITLIAIHLILIIATIIQLKLEGLYSKVILNFISCFLIVILMTFCEILVKRIQSGSHYNFRKNNGGFEHLELLYLNIYFIIYMICIIGFLGTGIYLVATEILIWAQQDQINRQIDNCLQDKQNSQNQECSICLTTITSLAFVKIKICQHAFHGRCLKGWLKHHQTCPLCRGNILGFRDNNLIQE